MACSDRLWFKSAVAVGPTDTRERPQTGGQAQGRRSAGFYKQVFQRCRENACSTAARDTVR